MRLRRWHRLRLRERVTLALVGLVGLFVFVLGVLATLSLAEQEDDLADAWVLAEAKRLAGIVDHAHPGAGIDADVFSPSSTLRAWLVEAPDKSVPEPLPLRLAGLKEGVHWQSGAEGELHIAVVNTRRGMLYVQFDAQATEDKVAEFAVYIVVLGALCVAVAFIVARRVACVVVEPIERLTARLSNWVPEAQPGATGAADEEEQLLEAFQRVQSRFESMVVREREFVADLSHEIRTPLTALRTDLEMLMFSSGDDPSRLQRLQRAVSMVDAVTESLESVRLVSLNQAAAAAFVDLRQCVEDAWASVQSDVGIDRLRFVNAIPAGATFAGDRHSLLTILRNLIRNAAEHAAPAACTVSFADGRLEVADDGAGIAADDLPYVFERYYRGRYKDSDGVSVSDRGLGLAIARQVAELNGWTLAASSEAGRGTRFSLRLA